MSVSGFWVAVGTASALTNVLQQLAPIPWPLFLVSYVIAQPLAVLRGMPGPWTKEI